MMYIIGVLAFALGALWYLARQAKKAHEMKVQALLNEAYKIIDENNRLSAELDVAKQMSVILKDPPAIEKPSFWASMWQAVIA
jgi:hypothetical protein